MSRYRDAAIAAAAILAAVIIAPAQAQDAAAGEKVFNRCKACHAVGEGAKHKVGPHLNDVFGRTAGTAEGYKYSKSMVEAGAGGLAWSHETLSEYLASPRSYVKGTKMAFAGLKKDEEIADVIAYLETFSKPEEEAGDAQSPPAAQQEAKAEPEAAAAAEMPESMAGAERAGAVFGLGRAATADEIAAWNIDVRPDGEGLPEGRGTVMQGEGIYTERCAACHGDFGEGIGRWPVLAGGHDTLKADRPEKTIGSYWPYLSTVYDYVNRAMPFGDARGLESDELYALTAYLLFLNDVVTDEDFELSKENFATVKLPNEANFFEDDRLSEPHYADRTHPCMTDCRPGLPTITMHAAVLDVTPESEEGNGGID
ncbi:c-type cytochrome [Aquibium oceanicum]|uniref:MFS transporter n=1 Tax=Aquibium oceanicum TaxID=1670800 RepID=A0A1L3SQT1_9HYPH|nr:c-type cytochrome [Aquibium oceanicum]APH71764.1 MFS transporter [Aquibium oceanicum]